VSASKSRQGRQKRTFVGGKDWKEKVLSSLPGLVWWGGRLPTVKTVGYFQEVPAGTLAVLWMQLELFTSGGVVYGETGT